MTAIRAALSIARRELAAAFHEPVAWVVLVLFLVVQGLSFYAVVKVLANPAQPAPYGAVLRMHFGGTFLYWTFLFFVVAAVTMRLVAEERRQGTWETLRTVPVGAGAIIAGKWLGALAFYAFLWAPTIVYPIILRAFAPPGAAPDWGPIATAYLGVLVTGAAFLALGLAASALTSNQIIASVLTFTLLLALLLFGLAPEIAPGAFARGTTLAALARAADVRAHMDDWARGIVDLRRLAFAAGVAATALAVAVVAANAPRLGRRRRLESLAGIALVAMAAVLVNVLAARHPARLDATAARVYTLDGKTRAILADVKRPVRAVVLRAGAREFADLYDEVRELLASFAAAQPLVTVEELDPALSPGRIETLAREYDLAVDELGGGGAVIFLVAASGGAGGERHRAVGLLDFASFARDEATGAGRLEEFRGEAEFAAAILEVSDPERPEVCFTSGHGEPGLSATPGGRDLATLAQALDRDAVRASELGALGDAVPARCAVLAVIGPRRPFSGGDGRAVAAYLAAGGRLLFAPDGVGETGLEVVLDAHGLRLGGVVEDPAQTPEEFTGWVTIDGYGEHPVSRAFLGRRATLWIEPRAVEGGEALVRASTGRVVAAAVGGRGSGDGVRGTGDGGPGSGSGSGSGSDSRIVVLGSARSFTSEVLDVQSAANDSFAASAVAWLTGRSKLVGVGAKTPEQFRVVMTPAQVDRLFYGCVVVLPALAGLFGAVLYVRRRRAK